MSETQGPSSARAYEPVADIARGGMGRVELVVRRERSFARVYAMKRLHPDLANDRDVGHMFLEEARIAGLIRHPNVVPVLDVGQDELGPFLVMEYVEGVAAYAPIVDAQQHQRSLAIGLCAEIARQAAHGLAAAHELEGAGGVHLSVVHRDVSPQNILLGFDGLARVTDFGVARALGARPEDESVLIGKLGYMSPEQLARGPIDARSDLFSLGVVLHELLTCERLYGGAREDVLRRVREEPPPDVRDARPDVPAELATLIRELLAKRAEDRPASSRIVADRLDAIVGKLRDAGEVVVLAPYLRATFEKERTEQRALVAAALERTHAELPLDEQSTRSDTPVRARSRDGEPETVKLVVPPREPTSPAETVSASTMKVPRWVVASALVAVLLVGIALANVMGALPPTAITPAAAVAGCADDTECGTRGAAFFCDAVERRCTSVLSPVCPEVYPASGEHDPQAILLGTIFDRSSPNQLARERAARLAVDGLDHAGGIDGRLVALVHCDSSVAGALAASDQLVRAHVEAIIGPSTSAEVESVFSAHAADGVLVMSPSATATQLGEVDRTVPGLLWRTAPPDGFQASVLMSELMRPPAATGLVVVRRANDVYAQSLSVLVQEGATHAGVRVDASQVFAERGALPGAAATAIASSPDAVLFLSSELADTAAFLDATAAIPAYDGVTIYVADVAANDDLVALTTTGARRFAQLRATRPAPPSTIITSEFASEYASANGGSNPLDHSFTAHTYDATALTLLGIGYAIGGGDLTGVRIAEGLRLVSAGSHEHRLLGANLPAIIAAMRAPSPDVNVVGASGTLDFDPTTEELTRATYQVLGLEGTPPHFTVLRTIEVANGAPSGDR